MPDISEPVFLALTVVGPLALYFLSAPLRRQLNGRFTALPAVAILIALCIYLPYALAATVETWWDTRYGHCASDPQFPALCWGDLETGLILWAYLTAAATPSLLVVRAVLHAERSRRAH